MCSVTYKLYCNNFVSSPYNFRGSQSRPQAVKYKQVYYHQYVSGFDFTSIKEAYALFIYVSVLKTVLRLALLFFSSLKFTKNVKY
jgi:hypothetical protein